MMRILLFCPRDWKDPRAGLAEDYAYEVFSRIAAQGHYVAWVCQARPSRRNLDPCVGAVEIVEGIQLVRMGVGPLHRWMAKSLALRLAGAGGLERKYDAVVECVNGRPLLAGLPLPLPVIPLVFRLPSRFKTPERPQGPWIAASKLARLQMFRLGLPENRSVLAPFGVNTRILAEPAERAALPLIAAATDSPRVLEEAMRYLAREGLAPSATVFSRTPRPSRHPHIQVRERGAEEDRLPVYRRAWVGYCAPGHESEALRMAACGLPVVCPDSAHAREFTAHEKTGLLVSAWRPHGRAAALLRLLTDELARRRWGAEALNRCRALSWDRTANAVRAAILSAVPRSDATGSSHGRLGDSS